MLENINSVIVKEQIDGSVFCDLFAGSGSVGDFFKNKYSIIANDYLYCLSTINKAKLENKSTPKFLRFIKQFGVDPFQYFNNKQFQVNSQYFITNNYSPKGNRQFFTEVNAIKIDGIRIEIDELYKNLVIDDRERNFLLASLVESVMGVSNTTGTYEAYLKNWDKRAFKALELIPIEISNVNAIKINTIHNRDSNELIRQVKGDILYLDPPYTITDYSSAYHLLESIAKYDYPRISGITGRRQELKKKSKYNRKEQALKNFEDLFRQAQFKHILVSYSTQGLVSVEEFVNLAKKFAVNGKVSIHEFPFRSYKNIRESQKENELKEIVIYFEKDNSIIKSPLNYTGSKYSIIDEIIKVLPRHISSFVDIMGGAFNVGANIVAEKIIYNEYLPHTFNLIKFLLEDDKKTLLTKIDGIIKEYGLKKTEKDPYLKLREDYNKTKDIYKLFVLHMYCFQNQMRFNSKLEFNSPVGNCSYNETLIERINLFAPKTPIYEILNSSYDKINLSDYDKDTVFYFDPPYFITSATYNDGKRGFIGWDADEETKLLDFITKLHEQGYKFILSNVLYHNDQSNYMLVDTIKTHNFFIKNIDDVGSKNSRDEVLITNYDWRENI
jgi:adenine-specific DNA-methyltransferase